MVFKPQQAHGTNKPQTPMELPADFVSDDRETESSLEVPPIEENKELKDGEITVFDHAHFIWMGDLNYRIDLQREELLQHIDSKNWAPLLEADQLKHQIAQKKVFEGFTEGALAFRPTYKYDAGTDNFDSSRKMRLPAFCDRVLWRTDPNIQSLSYQSHMELKVSDHKPVSAIISIKLAPFSTTPTKKTQSEQQQQQQQQQGSPSSKEANGMAKSGFPQKSYFKTTGSRFLKSFTKTPTAFVVGAIVLGALTYLLLR